METDEKGVNGVMCQGTSQGVINNTTYSSFVSLSPSFISLSLSLSLSLPLSLILSC